MPLQTLPPRSLPPSVRKETDRSPGVSALEKPSPFAGLRSRLTVLRVMAAVSIIAVVGGVIWWCDGGKYRFIPKRFGVVEEGAIYRSGQMSKWVVEDVMREHEIGAVVHLAAHDINDEHLQAELAYAKRHGIIVYRYPMRGNGTGDLNRITDAIQRIHRERKSGKRVLVHCHAGSNRTGTVIGYYRLLVQGWAAEDVRAEMLEFDFDPEENPETIPFFNAQAKAVSELLYQKKVLAGRVGAIPELRP